MMAVFAPGGWEILLILAVLAMMVAVPVIVVAIVLLANRQRTKPNLQQPPPIQPQQS